MPIVNFANAFQDAAASVQAAANAARYLKNTQGDLQSYALFNVWNTQQAANVAATSAMALAAANTAAADAALVNFIGAPQSVADLQTCFANIHTAASAFNAAFVAWRDANLVAADLWVIASVNAGGVSSDVLQDASFIPAAKIDLLRQTPELAALVAAFEAMGATA